jgi:FkbM family methyltransferase
MAAGKPQGAIASAEHVYSQTRDIARHIWNHPSNKGHRARRLAYATAFQLWARSTGRPMKVDVGQRSKMWARLHFSASSEVVYANPPSIELVTWSAYLNPGDWFIDVGSSVGVYTIFALEQGAEVTAFEPNADAAKLFRENMKLNGYSPDFHEAAVTYKTGTMSMTFDLDVANHVVLHPDERSHDVREVPTVTLDSIIGDRTVAGVKLDTEGTERLVLEGATRALADKRIRLFQLEWNYASIKVLGEDRTPVADMLRDAGYRLVRPNRRGELTRPVTDLSVTPDDLFAIPED